jgi:hypothetical protein
MGWCRPQAAEGGKRAIISFIMVSINLPTETCGFFSFSSPLKTTAFSGASQGYSCYDYTVKKIPEENAMIQYEITVEGHLTLNRLRDFEGFTATPLPDGKTKLSGNLPDQAALFSILNRIRDLNLPLVSVQKLSQTKEASL